MGGRIATRNVKKRRLRLKNFDEHLYRELQDPDFAAAYLEDALADSMEEFLVALRKYYGNVTLGLECRVLFHAAFSGLGTIKQMPGNLSGRFLGCQLRQG